LRAFAAVNMNLQVHSAAFSLTVSLRNFKLYNEEYSCVILQRGEPSTDLTQPNAASAPANTPNLVQIGSMSPVGNLVVVPHR
jgi:hypothetical protein